MVILENIFADEFPPLDRLYSTISGGSSQPPAVMLALSLEKIDLRLSSLERNPQYHSSGGLSSIVSPPPPSHFSSKLVEIKNHFKLLSTSHKSLKACIGQYVVDIGGVNFESRLQTVASVEKYLPSAAYFVY